MAWGILVVLLVTSGYGPAVISAQNSTCSCETKCVDLPELTYLLVTVEVVQVLGTCVMAAAVVFVIHRSSSRTAAAAALKRGSQQEQHGDINLSYEQSRHNSNTSNHTQK